MRANRVGRNVVLSSKHVATRKAVLKPGQVECPVCRKGVTPIDTKRIRRHRDLWGDDCPNRQLQPASVDPAVLASALAEAERRAMELAEARAAARLRPPTKARERKVVTGRCHTCDRPITGERIYCGPCLATRMQTRSGPGS